MTTAAVTGLSGASAMKGTREGSSSRTSTAKPENTALFSRLRASSLDVS
ncbi:hypothetical protein G5V59_19940 [Nocardioides sp. W3-2-3]|nr:hypothetical protein [Nocardioides convexus]NHA01337.1 hypothetical protein [Nocardioides convexus]